MSSRVAPLACSVWLALSLATGCGGEPQTPAQQGPILFATYCRRCHGEDGRGGRYAARTSTPPADLTDITLSAEEVRRTITEGVPGTDMPPHALDPAELDALVPYVMSLREPTATPGAEP